MKKFFILLLLTPSMLLGQMHFDVGVGYGVVSGTLSRGLTLHGNVDYPLGSKFIQRIRLEVLTARGQRYYQPPDWPPPLVLENTFSTARILIDLEDRERYNGLFVVTPNLQKERYLSLDYQLGWKVADIGKGAVRLYTGPSLCKYDAVIPLTAAWIYLEHLVKREMTFYGFALVRYYDLGWSSSVEYFRSFHNVLVGAELRGNFYFYSRKGYAQLNIKLRANL